MNVRPFSRLYLRRLKILKTPRVEVLFGVIGLGLICSAPFVSPTPMLVWNASASAPIGLYRVVSGAPKRGDLVLVQTPKSVAKLAAERGYLPLNVPLVKHVAALSGNEVCAFHEAIFVEGKVAAKRSKADKAGRPLLWWNDCRELRVGEFFLLTDDRSDSFDSRYFGPVSGANLIGRLVPLWTD
ncbi:conjugative transfer signal peptidase TraF [Methyloceanibacter sp.]|uniref:conjugative transfer signal peptidase TraF n=1 Tax=Methyloceanibacter sp. TaxID=1965321 RepID=UPI002CEC4003|nr:conjugative transfer signal peptidase TraF [Methyloceanibacter sp.]HML92969.1 conjugative transfer signal peptidase TraF [Methyloceanibacter sp.]